MESTFMCLSAISIIFQVLMQNPVDCIPLSRRRNHPVMKRTYWEELYDDDRFYPLPSSSSPLPAIMNNYGHHGYRPTVKPAPAPEFLEREDFDHVAGVVYDPPHPPSSNRREENPDNEISMFKREHLQEWFDVEAELINPDQVSPELRNVKFLRLSNSNNKDI